MNYKFLFLLLSSLIFSSSIFSSQDTINNMKAQISQLRTQGRPELADSIQTRLDSMISTHDKLRATLQSQLPDAAQREKDAQALAAHDQATADLKAEHERIKARTTGSPISSSVSASRLPSSSSQLDDLPRASALNAARLRELAEQASRSKENMNELSQNLKSAPLLRRRIYIGIALAAAAAVTGLGLFFWYKRSKRNSK